MSWRRFAGLAVAAGLLAACSSSRDQSAPTTSVPAETTTPVTTGATTTSTTTAPDTTRPERQAQRARSERQAQRARSERQQRCGQAGHQKREAQNEPDGSKRRRQQTRDAAPERQKRQKAHDQRDDAPGPRRQEGAKADRAPCRDDRPRDLRQAAAPPVRRMPLTGHVLTDGAQPPQRPALVVKIDNNSRARPQAGLNGADVVFEEIVEYGTRFAAVFHSAGANPVGPIRSGRTQDIAMLAGLNRPLFAWSGGNANVTRAIADSHLVDLSASHAGGYYRGSGSAPHNLYNSTDALWAQTHEGWQQPSPMFSYTPPGGSFGGMPAAGVELRMDTDLVRWDWDPANRRYLRFTNGAPHGALHGQVRTANVIVLGVEYRPSPADARSPEAQTVGGGDAWVFSAGRMLRGRWSRPAADAPYTLTTGVGDNARQIRLTPGRAFVELADIGADGPPAPIPPR